MMNKQSVFPLFYNVENKNVLLVGAGKIASRRIKTLQRFNLNLSLVAKEISDDIDTENIKILGTEFKEEHLLNQDIVLAMTNDKLLNLKIYDLCKSKKILVNICSDATKCDFYFPAIFENDDIIGAVVSKEGNKHSLVKEIAKKIREII